MFHNSDKLPMKLTLLLTIIMSFSGSLFAQQQDGRIIISPVSENYPTDGYFPRDSYNVAPVEEPKTVPTYERDAWFEQVGLTPYLTRWDQLDKDMLYMSAVGMPEARYLKKYQKLPVAKLRALRKLLMKKGVRS